MTTEPRNAGVPAFELIDRSGAIQEAREAITRASFMRKGLWAAGGALVAVARPARASAAIGRGDIAILNYALTLEYLQASFYTEAERMKGLHGNLADAARVLGGVERAHVTALQQALGTAAVKRPFFDFQGTTEAQQPFVRTAVAFEDLATAAYKAQLPLIHAAPVVQAAVSIHSVEARHAAWMRYLIGVIPAASAFDEPRSLRETTAIVASTHFIVKQAPTEQSGAKPPYTG
jgi:hypothetical protein